jgi:hypothetical protein
MNLPAAELIASMQGSHAPPEMFALPTMPAGVIATSAASPKSAPT